MTVRPFSSGLALFALAFTSSAQVDPHPKEVHRLVHETSMKDFVIASVDFQELKPGHEGPGYVKMTGEPARAARQIAEITLYSQDAVRNVRFETIDATGRLIAPIPAIKVDHDPENGEYMVLVDVPQQPFRIRAAGVDLTGAVFERVFRRLFQPSATKHVMPPADPFEIELMARFEAERKAHPDGAIAISPINVSSVGYEPLVTNGSLQGIRIWYSVRFGADGLYSLSPHVFPVYEDFDSRGLVTMRVLREKLDPLPELPPSVSPHDLLKLGVTAKYRGGIEYRAVVELIPDYVVPNTLQNKFCIYEAKFPTEGKGRDSWNLVKSNPAPVQYRVDLPGLNFSSETELFHPQRSFYESYLKQGAFDCGATPPVRF